MNVGIYQAAAALNANARWQELIAQNLSASSIPGFKKQELSFATVEAGLKPVASGDAAHFVMPQAIAATNFSQGQVMHTGINTNVALEGRGFFAVQLPDGNTAYTRDGAFQMNSSGQLLTKEGYAVLGEGGPIQLDLNNHTELSISSTGEVSQGTDVKGRLRVVDFNEPTLLTPISQGYFLASNPNLQMVEATEASVRQSFLESSNTTPVVEMAKLMTAMRLYEANQRVIQLHDERMSRTIQELNA